MYTWYCTFANTSSCECTATRKTYLQVGNSTYKQKKCAINQCWHFFLQFTHNVDFLHPLKTL